jgi:hypothetical protein
MYYDIAAITTTDASAPSRVTSRPEDDLRRLLDVRREDNEQMLTAIRAEAEMSCRVPEVRQ